jgi:hypothetical protein
MAALSRHAIALALICSGCGRVAFDRADDASAIDPDALRDDAGGDADLADAGIVPGVRVWTYDIVPASMVTDIAIAPADLTRTMLLCDYRTNTSSVGRQPACELTSSTSARVTTGLLEPSLRVHLQVVQLPEGSRVQRGVYVMTSGTQTQAVTIDPFDVTRAFPLISRFGGLDSSGFDDRFSLSVRLPSAQSIAFDRYSTGNTLTVPWQVVEIAGSRVVAGSTLFSDGTNGMIFPDVGVVAERSFVVLTTRTTSSVEANYLVRASLSQEAMQTNLTVQRAQPTSTAEIAWYVVELPDESATVQHGVTSQGAVSTVVAPLPAAVDPAYAAAFIQASGGRVGQVADVQQVVVTPRLRTTELELERNASTPLDVTGMVSWFVIHWAP